MLWCGTAMGVGGEGRTAAYGKRVGFNSLPVGPDAARERLTKKRCQESRRGRPDQYVGRNGRPGNWAGMSDRDVLVHRMFHRPGMCFCQTASVRETALRCRMVY